MEKVILKYKATEAAGLNAKSEEAELIAGAKSGQEQAFEQIFRLHKDRVFSICMRMTGNYYEAEDLLQDSFLLVFRNIAGFRGDSSFSTWLSRVVVNAVIDSLRRRHPHMNRDIEEMTESEIPHTPDARRTGDLTMERLRLERAIAALSPGYRAVFVLHDVEGYSHEEISRWIGSSVGTCKSQLHKARRKMRELLTGD